jgi:membrane protein
MKIPTLRWMPALISSRDWILRGLRAAYAVFRQTQEAGLDYRAMSLVYTSLLALIPLLAVSFSMLKAFGADSYLEPFLIEVLKPLRGNTEAVASTLLNSVKQLDVSVLGSIGLLSLLYTSVSLLDKIEDSFNYIWRRKGKVSRSLMRRFSDYLSFILVGPLLVFSAFGGMNEIFRRAHDLQWIEGRIGPLLLALQAVLPYLFTVAAFTFLYQIIPDAPVKLRSAAFGGLLAGLSWKLVGWVFGVFMAGSAQYHAVYSTFAILILVMVWLYLSWLIVLVGVQVTFFHQYPRYLLLRYGPLRLSARVSEHLGLLLMVLIGRRFFSGEPAWNTQALSQQLSVPDECVEELLTVLTAHGLLIVLSGEAVAWMPARDLSTIAIADIVQALRNAHEEEFPMQAAWNETRVATVLADVDAAWREATGAMTLRDLVLEGGK